MIDSILSMKCENGQWRPVVFLSKSLNETKKLQDLQQRDISSNKEVGKLEVLIRRC